MHMPAAHARSKRGFCDEDVASGGADDNGDASEVEVEVEVEDEIELDLSFMKS